MRILLLCFLASLSLQAATLYKSISANPSRLNPLLATDSSSGAITSYLFNGLVKYDKNATIVGDLAESFKILSPTSVRFFLRKDVLWHDGEPFTAKDVKFTYDVIMGKNISTPYSTDFRKVKAVVIEDDHTLRVDYTQPYYKIVEIWMMGMIPKHILEYESNFLTSSFNQRPVGTGPYILEKIEFSKEIVLKGNPNYYEHPPKIDSIVYSIIPDASTNFYMLQKGQLDVGSLSALQLEKKVDQEFLDRFQLIEEIEKAYTYLGFNLDKKRFTLNVRKAIALGIDKKELVDILFFKHGEVCYGPFLPGTTAYNKDFEKESFNADEARTLLKKEGYDKKHPFRFELVTNSGNPTRLAAAQIIQHQLKQIGVEITLRIMEWQAFLNTVVFPKEFDAILLGWSLSIKPDAYTTWHSDGIKKNGFNLGNYRNAKVDSLIDEAEQEVDPERFATLYKEIFAIIVRDHAYVFLYIPNGINVVNKSIHPIERSIIGLEHNIIDWIKN